MDALAGRLSFDRALSLRVRVEVEDHLREAADAGGGTPEAERRAIEGFGDPVAVAAQFARLSLAKRTREVAVAVIAAIAFSYIAMKARLAWYSLAAWTLSEEARAVSAVLASIDRWAFWLAALAGLGAAAFAYFGRTRRFCLVGWLATGALGVSVVCDAILTGLRLREATLSFGFAVPLFSVLVELTCAAMLAFYLRGLMRRL